MARARGAARGLLWGGVAACIGLAALAALAALPPGGAQLAPPLDANAAQIAGRRAEAAFADAERVWTARFRSELGRAYAPAEVRYFSGKTESTCAGSEAVAGPFYCAATGVVALDLAFLDGLGRRLRADAERASAVFVARASAAHAQADLGLSGGSAQADCLAGVWAGDAAPRIGAVSPDLYGRMLVSAREVADEGATGWRDAELFAPGARGARQDAFARGLEAGALAVCIEG